MEWEFSFSFKLFIITNKLDKAVQEWHFEEKEKKLFKSYIWKS